MDVTVAVDTNVEVTHSNRVLLSPVEHEKEAGKTKTNPKAKTSSFIAERGNDETSGISDSYDNDNEKNDDNDRSSSIIITPESDLANAQRQIWIVTTAGLPWRTGTAVNPLMRALYLCRGRKRHAVTLVIPWLPDAKSRQKLYGTSESSYFANKDEQEAWIRNYSRTSCKCPGKDNVEYILYFDFLALISVYNMQNIISRIKTNANLFFTLHHFPGFGFLFAISMHYRRGRTIAYQVLGGELSCRLWVHFPH
jgi:hypothetical protein